MGEKVVESYRYLGVHLGNSLDWRHHSEADKSVSVVYLYFNSHEVKHKADVR